jgi:hypothetical protein
MKKVIGMLMFTVIATCVFAQEFKVPDDYVFSTSEDYAKYETDILKGIDWLTNTPIKTQPDKRKEVNSFVVLWLTGCPDVSVEVNTDIINFIEPNPELLMIFMCGWTKYSLETKDYNNKIMGNLKGIEAVIDFYSRNRENMEKDKNVEKYMKMKEKGTLEEFITKHV